MRLIPANSQRSSKQDPPQITNGCANNKIANNGFGTANKRLAQILKLLVWIRGSSRRMVYYNSSVGLNSHISDYNRGFRTGLGLF
jgi:hypothetical protein